MILVPLQLITGTTRRVLHILLYALVHEAPHIVKVMKIILSTHINKIKIDIRKFVKKLHLNVIEYFHYK